ncbi:MAG: hypothetical protein OEO23_02835 [Gemmatimonadota bacterium]|nr:hypothetical protein [Gemmatimonadota bacterium]
MRWSSLVLTPLVGVLALGVGGATLGAEWEACLQPASPEYYQFAMVPTGRVPGTGNARGTADVWFPHTPFGVAVSPDGSYRYEFRLRFERLRLPRQGSFVVWVTTTDLDQVEAVGELTDPAAFEGEVGWNKFLVVVTHEDAFDPEAATWQGPVVIRGMSRSGMMHTMAGHGPFEQEKCSSYGYE